MVLIQNLDMNFKNESHESSDLFKKKLSKETENISNLQNYNLYKLPFYLIALNLIFSYR